ncbi:hypothetical protein BC567DRAFT_52600 [Phyllosticta citribraziliensis]
MKERTEVEKRDTNTAFVVSPPSYSGLVLALSRLVWSGRRRRLQPPLPRCPDTRRSTAKTMRSQQQSLGASAARTVVGSQPREALDRGPRPDLLITTTRGRWCHSRLYRAVDAPFCPCVSTSQRRRGPSWQGPRWRRGLWAPLCQIDGILLSRRLEAGPTKETTRLAEPRGPRRRLFVFD